LNHLLKELPENERPRERLEKYGPSSLSDSELIAIILRTGTKNLSVLSLASNILCEYETINDLSEVTIEELCKIKGIHKAKAITLLASIELGKRIVLNNRTENKVINSPKDAYDYLRTSMENLDHEELVCLFLNIRSEVIRQKRITVGTNNSTLLDPKTILKWALKYSSEYIIVAHNHPSGNPTPSENDRIVTMNLQKAAKEVDIKLVDHIIIGKNKYYSFLENNNKYKKKII